MSDGKQTTTSVFGVGSNENTSQETVTTTPASGVTARRGFLAGSLGVLGVASTIPVAHAAKFGSLSVARPSNAAAMHPSSTTANVYPATSREIAAQVELARLNYPPGNILRYGADATGVVPSEQAIQDAIDTNDAVFVPAGTYLVSAMLMTPPYMSITGMGRGSILKKNYDGPIINLGPQCSLQQLKMDGSHPFAPKYDDQGLLMPTFNGDAVVIDSGYNSQSPDGEGFQYISHVFFIDVKGYCVHYSLPNCGHMSQVSFCHFIDFHASAAVAWPDERPIGPIGGAGNRTVAHCYSDGPIVNVGGCDNGRIVDNDVNKHRSSGVPDGINFPPLEEFYGPNDAQGRGNPAEKLFIANNRFASTRTIYIRGIDIIFKNNIFAGTVVLAENNMAAIGGARDVKFRDNEVLLSVEDQSGPFGNNQIFLEKHSNKADFLWTNEAGSVLSFANSSVSCLWIRSGQFVEAHYAISFGSAVDFASLENGELMGWEFELPVPPQSSHVTPSVGTATMSDRVSDTAIACKTNFHKGRDSISFYTGDGKMLGKNDGLVWSSGHSIHAFIRYRVS